MLVFFYALDSNPDAHETTVRTVSCLQVKNSFGSGAAGWGAGWWAEQGGVPVDPGFLQQAPGPEGQGEEDVQGNTAPALSLDVQILYSCWTGFKILIQDTVNKNSELLTILSDNAGKSKNMIFKIIFLLFLDSIFFFFNCLCHDYIYLMFFHHV